MRAHAGLPRRLAGRQSALPPAPRRTCRCSTIRYGSTTRDSTSTRHLHHAHLPAPGGERQLKQLAGRMMGTRLDRAKPLWEMWFVDGLAGRRVALIGKFHHCMIDGMAGRRHARGRCCASTADAELGTPAPWQPRPAPSGARLLADELARRAAAPLDAAARRRRAAARSARRLRRCRRAARCTTSATRPARPGRRLADAAQRRGRAAPPLRLDAHRPRRGEGDQGAPRRHGQRRRPGRGRRRRRPPPGAAGVDVGGLDFRLTMPANVRAAGEHGASATASAC